jgi:hypothetical protein
LRIPGNKAHEVTEGWRRLDDGVIHNLCSSPDISAIKSRRMRQEGHAARMREIRISYTILVGVSEVEETTWGVLGVRGGMILKWLLKK